MNSERLNFRPAPAPINATVVWRRIHRQHIVSGGIAVVVSVLLHVLLLSLFPGFDIGGFVRERMAEAQRPLRLQDVRLPQETPDITERPARFRPETTEVGGTGPGGAESASLRRPVDESTLEPRETGPGVLLGEKSSLREPVAAERPMWQPRAEIIQIESKIARDQDSALPRRYTPKIERLSGAADIVQPVDRSELGKGPGDLSVIGTLGDPSRFAWGRPAGGGGRAGSGRAPARVTPPVTPSVPDERELAMANLKRLEKLLRADAYVYHSLTDPHYVYCRIEIKRRGDDVLPVLAKDVLFVQDASASITEQKLHFCREGLLKALAQLGPDDRFNVVEFRDKAARCFPDWAAVNPDTLTKARDFIGQMKSAGDTDIFGSLKDLLDVSRQPGRPVIMEMISDGVATVGLTDRSKIIEAFSQENRGGVSVFTLGTYPGANAYLLDLLSARNRGDSTIVRTGRWDIPAVTEARMREVARPVLNDVRFRFSGQASEETLPRLTSNLYLDKPLVLFARYPRDLRRVVFQAAGQAGDVTCDMVFDLDLAKAAAGDREIRTQWAWQKIYDLIGEHHRTQQASVLARMRDIARTYGIRVPYRDELKP
jgi:hypothetical protein